MHDIGIPSGDWLPNPPDGMSVCAGFDGSLNDDWTAIKMETRDGFIFTPRYGPDKRPAIWNPAEWGGLIPRAEVDAAWSELAERYRLLRAYWDPGFHDETDWTTEGEAWDIAYGPGVFVPWPTTSFTRMFPALRRFESDMKSIITHDGCPVTAGHMRNARKFAKRNGYILGKPSPQQKIDAAVTSVLAHEAASDMRAAGWPDDEPAWFMSF